MWHEPLTKRGHVHARSPVIIEGISIKDPKKPKQHENWNEITPKSQRAPDALPGKDMRLKRADEGKGKRKLQKTRHNEAKLYALARTTKEAPIPTSDSKLCKLYARVINNTEEIHTLTHAIWNVNGINNLHKTGHLRQFLLKYSPAVLALGEIKISYKKLLKNKKLHLLLAAFGYEYRHWHPCNLLNRQGLFGTALFFKQKPLRVLSGWAHCNDEDEEGRLITSIFESHILIHTYSPCSSYPERKATMEQRARKDDKRRDFDILLTQHCKFLATNLDKPLILCGDLNVTPTDDDVNIPKQNLHTYAGHTPWERKLFHDRNEQLKLVDAYRHFNPTPSASDHTHWESGHLWSLSMGQRIDHILVSRALLEQPGSTPHIANVYTDQHQEGSDHFLRPLYKKTNLEKT